MTELAVILLLAVMDALILTATAAADKYSEISPVSEENSEDDKNINKKEKKA